MAYLTASSVTVTLNPEDIDRSPDGRIGIRTFPSVAFGDGDLQYPALGIPMPNIGAFGFSFAIKRAYIENPGNGYIYSFDRANHKVRIWLGAAVAISVANHVNIALPAPTGNLANLAFAGDPVAPGTPAGNLANLAAGAFTGDALANITPTGNLANLAAAAHSHDLVVAANSQGDADVDVGVNVANLSLVGNAANAATIAGGNATTGGIANTTPGNGTGDFVGDALAPGTPTGNVANGTGDFVGDPLANITPAGNVTGDFVGDTPSNLANLTHTVTGNTAEAALAEMDAGVAPAATTLNMEMVGR